METKRILIVEDEQVSRTALADLLAEEGYQVDTAGSVAGGIAVCVGNGAGPQIPDLAIVDHKLPDGTGLEIAAHLKQQTPPRPVIVVSGSAELEVGTDGNLTFTVSLIPEPHILFSLLASELVEV